MTEVDQLLPVNIDGKSEHILEDILLYFKDKWNRDICEKLKRGYYEMSQINLTLAEMGLEQDMMDLCSYETKLGCEKL